MNKITSTIVVLALFGMIAVSTQAQDDVNKFEIFAGYAYMNLNRGIDPDEFNDDLSDFPGNRVNAHGFNASATYNFKRYVGAKFDMSLHGHSQDYESFVIATPTVAPLGTVGSYKLEQKVNQFMGGIQIKDNSKDGPKFKPFAHFLGGFATQSIQLEERGVSGEIIPFDVNSTDFDLKMGAGIDYRVHKNVDIRLFQIDWNPIFRQDQFFGATLGKVPGVLQNNIQLTFGVVFH